MMNKTIESDIIKGMIKSGEATLSLHAGSVPRWLFEKMCALAACIVETVIMSEGRGEFLKRISDPFWFQAFGCVLGFDWHSSGLTTTVTAALKEGLKGKEERLGIFFCGGKGRASRQTPSQVQEACKKLNLDASRFIYSSKMSAKVDSAAVQDGHTLYHHFFILTKEGEWAVVQQGMNIEERTARRYHWLSKNFESFVREPHAAVCGTKKESALNMVAEESKEAQEVSVHLCSNPALFKRCAKKMLSMPMHHPIFAEDLCSERLYTIILKTYERGVKDFEQLLSTEGVGPKTIRALALISELIYGHPPSFKDPARFSFAHGGKDRHPYPVDPVQYQRSIHILERAIKEALLKKEKHLALKRLLNIHHLCDASTTST